MATRQELHALVDTLPEEAIETAHRILLRMQVWPPPAPPSVEEMLKRMEERLPRCNAATETRHDCWIRWQWWLRSDERCGIFQLPVLGRGHFSPGDVAESERA